MKYNFVLQRSKRVFTIHQTWALIRLAPENNQLIYHWGMMIGIQLHELAISKHLPMLTFSRQVIFL